MPATGNHQTIKRKNGTELFLFAILHLIINMKGLFQFQTVFPPKQYTVQDKNVTIKWSKIPPHPIVRTKSERGKLRGYQTECEMGMGTTQKYESNFYIEDSLGKEKSTTLQTEEK